MPRLDLPRHPLALLDELLGAPRPIRRAPAASPFEIHAHDDGLTLFTPLPGLDPAAIDVSLERGELRIRAERRPLVSEGAAGARVIARELPQEPVDLRLRLGFEPDAAGVHAAYELGVLRIDLPRAPQERPRRIPVHTSEAE